MTWLDTYNKHKIFNNIKFLFVRFHHNVISNDSIRLVTALWMLQNTQVHKHHGSTQCTNMYMVHYHKNIQVLYSHIPNVYPQCTNMYIVQYNNIYTTKIFKYTHKSNVCTHRHKYVHSTLSQKQSSTHTHIMSIHIYKRRQ